LTSPRSQCRYGQTAKRQGDFPNTACLLAIRPAVRPIVPESQGAAPSGGRRENGLDPSRPVPVIPVLQPGSRECPGYSRRACVATWKTGDGSTQFSGFECGGFPKAHGLLG